MPFSKMSCCAYSGAYPTGYGNCKVNTHGRIGKMYPYHRFCGFTHIRPSGTGFIDYFYNFALISPSTEPQPIQREEGEPGYYSCETAAGVFSCTVTADSAFHHFDFLASSGRVYVDFSQYGLNKKAPNLSTTYDRARCYLDGDVLLCATSFYNVPIYYAMFSRNALSVALYDGDKIGVEEISHDSYVGKFGAIFDFSETGETILSISFRSIEHAKELLIRDKERAFKDVRANARRIWNETLSRIDVTGSESDQRLFYTNLYFSLVKPTDVSGEKPYGFDGAAITDIATMWDMYKTELPLLFSVYPEIGEKIIDTMVSFFDAHEFLPNSYLISPEQSLQTGQAKFLSAYVFADALLRGIGDAAEMYRVLRSEYMSDAFAQFRATGAEARTTHTMDIIEGQRCLGLIAEAVGDTEFAKTLYTGYQKIAKVYSPRTGLLWRRSRYYEGNHINYSFRLHSDEQMRISAAGGRQRLLRLLDYFFGYRHPHIGYGKFEGFNNETDMEAPYAYHFIDRHDRISEIIDASRQYMWRCTRGGMPGNNDTGALSSLYVWNAIGLFPVSGQNKMIVGSPLFDEVTINIKDHELHLRKQGKGIYVSALSIDGVNAQRLQCAVSDFMQAENMVFHCVETPPPTTDRDALAD